MSPKIWRVRLCYCPLSFSTMFQDTGKTIYLVPVLIRFPLRGKVGRSSSFSIGTSTVIFALFLFSSPHSLHSPGLFSIPQKEKIEFSFEKGQRAWIWEIVEPTKVSRGSMDPGSPQPLIRIQKPSRLFFSCSHAKS